MAKRKDVSAGRVGNTVEVSDAPVGRSYTTPERGAPGLPVRYVKTLARLAAHGLRAFPAGLAGPGSVVTAKSADPDPSEVPAPLQGIDRPPELRSWRAAVVTRLMHLYFLATRAMTLGVRAAVFDEKGRVFLVRHSYVPGWHMPGGGIERGETARQALDKELREEGNIALTEMPELFAVYYNRGTSRRDHVIFYCCRNARQTAVKRPDREILEAGFYPLDALPDDVTGATRRRLAEIAGTQPPAHFW